MDPDVALGLFEEGATLVLLGVPEGTELGLDYKTWGVGPRFRGVKMIPPGIHFLHYSPVNPQGGELGPKRGVFLSLKPRQVLLAHWDKNEEDLDFSASENADEVSRVRAGLRELDSYLGPYPYDTLRKWVSLTDKLSMDLASALQPLSGRVCAFSDVIPELQLTHTKDRTEQNLPRNDTLCQSMKEGLDRLPRMKQREGTEFRFSQIPQHAYPPGATPAQITQCSMDLSYSLNLLLEKHHKEQPLNVLGTRPLHFPFKVLVAKQHKSVTIERFTVMFIIVYVQNGLKCVCVCVLGELQFAFVCFLLGNVYEGFEHWKQLLLVLCRSEEAMRERSDLYLGLISVLYHQLGEIPPDFFVDIVSQNNFLTSTLQV